MTHRRLSESRKRSHHQSGGSSRVSSMLPRLMTRSNQKLIAGYPSDSPVSTTDEECEVEDLSYLRHHSKFGPESFESTGQDDWSTSGRIGGPGVPGGQQHQLMPLLQGSSGSRGSKRHWAPGEGIIDQHLFLLDDRPWQEFYTLFYTPGYCVTALGLALLLLLLLLDGTLLFGRLLIFAMPCVILAVGLLCNFLIICLFPVPNGSSATAFDNWADPFDQQ